MKLTCYRPSKTEGVGTSHLKLIWVMSLSNSIMTPHLLKHRIPKQPRHAAATRDVDRLDARYATQLSLVYVLYTKL